MDWKKHNDLKEIRKLTEPHWTLKNSCTPGVAVVSK